MGVVCQGPMELVLPRGVLGGTGSFRVPGCLSDPKRDGIGTPEDFMFFRRYRRCFQWKQRQN